MHLAYATILQKSSYVAQEKFLIIINVENSCAA